MAIKKILLTSVACVSVVFAASQVSAQAPGKDSGAPAASEQRGAPAGQAAKPEAKPDAKSAPNAREEGGGKAMEHNSTAQKSMDSDSEKGGAQRPATAQSKDKADDKAPKAAQGQPEKAGDKSAAPNRNAADTKPGDNKAGSKAAEGQHNQTTGQGAGGAAARGARVTLNATQKTRVHDIVLKENVKKVTKVTFNVSVGTKVVRSRDIELRPLSTQIIEVVPEYRGYLFFVYNDEVVIVEPDTLEIVTIITV